MRFETKLEQAILVRRYKRFLADIVCPDGKQLTIHCPNSGSMRSCSEPGSQICYSTSDNPKRKYPHTLEMVMSNGVWVGVNTALTNRLVAEAFENGTIKSYSQFDSLKREVKTSQNSRLDMMLRTGSERIYIEVKNCSMVEDECARFPDAVTSRGTKHLNELTRLVEEGNRAIIFFLVQRMDATHFEPAAAIDPLYADTLAKAAKSGVEILVYQAEVSPEAIEVVTPLPFTLGSFNG